MVETYEGPSELHLKKELTTLQKARVLRDPATRTSWKSLLRSNSFGSTINLNDANETSEIQTEVNDPNGSSMLPGFEKRRKKVYLYNWGNHSRKSSDSGLKLDEDSKPASGQTSPQADLDTNPILPLTIYDVKGKNPVRRAARKLNRVNVTRRRTDKNLSTRKLLDPSPNSLGGLRSAELSDVSGCCSSEEFPQSKYTPTRKFSCCSHHTSPSISRSGCGNCSNSKTARRRDGLSHSYTPASNRSYNRHGAQNLGTGRTWDKTSASSDGKSMVNIRRNQVCGLPCYWPKETEVAGLKSYSSLSESDTPSRIVRSILCGRRTMNHKRRLSGFHKHKYIAESSHGVPLLTNSFDVVSFSTDSATDDLASTFGEIDLEAVSRLDGQRWSSCRIPEGFNSEMVEQNSLSQKYMPRTFGEIVGHNIVVESLRNAILRGKVASAYLFQGPHGTGKTSCARIFGAALNCLSAKEDRPCRFCGECTNFATGNVSYLTEVDATNKKDIGRMRLSLKTILTGKTLYRYKIFVIDECHMLSSKSWSEFMNFLDDTLPCAVFIFITTDPDSLPRAVVSRCQKYHFPKIKDTDIALRLRRISTEENLDVELDALDLIALNSDGSLQEAEKMLDQLSLLDKRITTNLVNDLIGLVPSERLLDLLEVALSSNTVETVKRSRELIESGVDPVMLMSQLAGLIMDKIAGTSQLPSSQSIGTVPGVGSLTDFEVERLQKALKILSDAEKQLRLSSEQSTWFTAALLQLNSGQSLQHTPSRNSSRQNIERMHEGSFEKVRGTSSLGKKLSPSLGLHTSTSVAIPRTTSGRYSTSITRRSLDNTHKVDAIKERFQKCGSPDMLDEIWKRCIERFDSESLRHLLYVHGKLVSIQETKGVLIAYIAFGDGNIKSRAERFLSSITDSIRIVLKHNVEVRIGLVPEIYLKALNSVSNSPSSQDTDASEYLGKVGKEEVGCIHYSSDIPRRSTEYSETRHRATPEKVGIHEQRLESAWIQAAGKVEDPKVRHFENGNHPYQKKASRQTENNRSFPDLSVSFKHRRDGPNNEIEELETNVSLGHHKEHISERVGRRNYAISPSFLRSHSLKTNFDQASMGYESGPAQSRFCCWKASKAHRGKVKQRNDVRSRKGKSCLGEMLKM